MTRVRADLNSAVLQFYVGERNSVILVDPVGVQGQITMKFVFVPHVFVGTLRIVVPAVKDGVETLGLRHILQGMRADKHLLGIVQLVGHHVEGYFAALLQHEGAHIQCAIAIVKVRAEIAQIVAGSVEKLLDGIELLILVLRKIQSQNARCDGRREGGTVHTAVTTAHLGSINCTRGYEIHVFTIVGVCGQLPAILSQSAHTEHILVCCGICQSRSCIVAHGGYTDHVAVESKLCRLGKGIGWIGRCERHIHHSHIALNGIVQTKHQIRRAFEHAVFVTLCLDDNNINLRGNTHHTVAIHRSRNNPRHGCTMTLLVLYQRPIVRTVGKHIILDNLILSGIVGILADTPRELGVIRVYTRVNHRNRDTLAFCLVPDIAHVEVVQIGLAVVVGIAYGVLRTNGQSLIRNLLLRLVARQKIADIGLIVQRHIFDVFTVFLILVNIEDCDTFGQSQRRKASVLGDSKLRAKGLGQILRPRFGSIRQNNTLGIIPPLVVVKLLQSLVLLFFQHFLALVEHQHGDGTRYKAQDQYAN